MSKTNLAYKHKKIDLTDEEYLAAEREAFEKSELINGRVCQMAGASEMHNVISSNLNGELFLQTKNTACRAFASDMRVKAKKGNYYYPDIVVACGERKFEDSKKHVLLNPKVVIEVLSKSTKLKDRNEKLDSYMSNETVTDYALIEQDEMRIEHFVNISEREWKVFLLTEKTDKLVLSAIKAQITLADIHRDVKFPK